MPSHAGPGTVSRPATMMVLAAVIVAGLTAVWAASAQSVCRGECDEDFRACQRACAMAQSFDACIGSCRQAYDRCVATCE